MFDGLVKEVMVGGGILFLLMGSKGLFVVMIIVMVLIEIYCFII